MDIDYMFAEDEEHLLLLPSRSTPALLQFPVPLSLRQIDPYIFLAEGS